jgi:hypothetical protein
MAHQTRKSAATKSSVAAQAGDGLPPRQVGAGTHPGVGGEPTPGSAPGAGEDAAPNPDQDEITQDLRVHAAAVAAGLPDEVVAAACGPRAEVTDVLTARRYADRWVLVVMTARAAFKVEVPDA